MKKLNLIAAVTALILVLSSCSKDPVAGIMTIEFDILSTEWSSSGTSGTSNFQYAHAESIPELTQDIVDNGAVLAYVLVSPQWATLPYVETYGTYTVIYNYQYQAGTVYITRKDTDLYTIPPGSTISVKLILMPMEEKHLLNGVDVTNLEQVEEALNLK